MIINENNELIKIDKTDISKDGVCVIPFGVWSIAAKAFYYNGELSEVIIPPSVAMIQARAFEGANLKNLKLPNSITHIGPYAFANCHYLKSVTIPDSVKHLGNNAFKSCIRLESIQFSNSLDSIPREVCVCCYNLKDITLPQNLKRISGGAFAETRILKLNLPETLGDIGKKAFMNCRDLREINIHSQSLKFDEESFRQCSKLTQVNLNNCMPLIQDYAFWGCGSLESISINTNVTIPGDAFGHCHDSFKINMPEKESEKSDDLFNAAINSKMSDVANVKISSIDEAER